MAPNFSKNAILESNVDSFCLVCETYLKSEKEKLNHILQDNHIKNLKTTNYVEQFKGDGIKKIKNKYFCELCNRLLPVLHRVRLHITETMHIDNKNESKCSIKRINNIVVAMEDIVINEQAWHGFSENFCAICNIEYGDEAKHKCESTHIINLIQIKVKFDSENNLYRKLDEESCQCLTCNMVLASNTISSHFSELEHKNKLQACRDAIKNIHKEKVIGNKVAFATNDEVSGTEKITSKEGIINKDIKPKVPEPKIEEGKNEINPKPATVINVANEKKNHVTPSRKEKEIYSEYKYDEKSEENIIRILECKDYITRDENNKIWCILCGWIMDLQKIPEHIRGRHHRVLLKMHKQHIEKMKQNNLVSQKIISENYDRENDEQIKNKNMTTVDVNTAIQQQKVNKQNEHKTADTREINSKLTVDEENVSSLANETEAVVSKEIKNDIKVSKIQRPKFKNTPPPKIPMRAFVKNLSAMESVMFKDLIINERICVGFLNFLFVIPLDGIEGAVRCLACKVTGEGVRSHINTSSHIKVSEECLVVTQLDLEFIREIHPEEYHCGHCNIVVQSWDDMLAHMNSASHIQCKNTACWRLQNYRPTIDRERVEQHLKEMFFMNMFSNFF